MKLPTTHRGGVKASPSATRDAMGANKYHTLLRRILKEGAEQSAGKGSSRYLTNQLLTLTPADLLDIFEGHAIARRKLRDELALFMEGEYSTEVYSQAGITWWDYCGASLRNSYPTFFAELPALIGKINAELGASKNYVLHLGATGADTPQAPCLSLIQFQIIDGALLISAYQRSSDASLGLPADLYHLYLIARMIDAPLRSISLFIANVHIYTSNILSTYKLLAGDRDAKFTLNT